MTNTTSSKGNSALQFIQRGILSLGLSAGLAVAGLGFVGHAEARVPAGDPRIDSLAAQCGAIQDAYDAARDQYNDIGRANASDPRLPGLLQQIQQLGQAWDDICSGSFGGINFSPLLPPGSGVHKVTGVDTFKPSPTHDNGTHQSTGGTNHSAD